MTRPSMHRTLLEVVDAMARRGTCSRAHVGAVLARDGRVLATAYNGAPRGMPHCVHPPSEVSNRSDPGAPTCTWAVHAEANAVAFAARYGIALDGATLYCSLGPCIVCAQLVVNAGVAAVVAARAYRDASGVDLLLEAGVEVHYYVATSDSLVTVELDAS